MAVLEAERPSSPGVEDGGADLAALAALGAEREQFRVAGDLAANGRYGRRWLGVTDRRVYVFDGDPD